MWPELLISEGPETNIAGLSYKYWWGVLARYLGFKGQVIESTHSRISQCPCLFFNLVMRIQHPSLIMPRSWLFALTRFGIIYFLATHGCYPRSANLRGVIRVPCCCCGFVCRIRLRIFIWNMPVSTDRDSCAENIFSAVQDCWAFTLFRHGIEHNGIRFRHRSLGHLNLPLLSEETLTRTCEWWSAFLEMCCAVFNFLLDGYLRRAAETLA